jgi:sigma54-dependent transcription regulator
MNEYESTQVSKDFSAHLNLFKSSILGMPKLSTLTSTAASVASCSPEQRRILDLVSDGKNVFFTGPAGVGKSFVMKQIIELFKSQGKKEMSDFFVTASTGSPSSMQG